MSEVLDYFNSFYEPSRRHQDAMSDEWSEYERAFYGEPEQPKPTGDDAWKSYIFYKYAFQQVETLVALLATDDIPTFSWEPRSAEQEDNAQLIDSLIGYLLQRDNYVDKRLKVIKYAAIYGGCPLKVHWSYKCVTRRRLTASGMVEEKFVVKDQPTVTIIDPRDFMYDVRARDMSECRYAFHRMRLTIDELKSRKRSDGKPLYKNLSELEDTAGGLDPANRQLDHDFSGERDKALREGIEVIEMWTSDRVIVRAGGNVIIRDDPNPFWHGRLPFEVITLMPSLNDVWGESIVWLLRDPQENIWTLDNAANDALKKGIDPPLAVDMDDPDNATRPAAPGERFPSKSPKDALVPLKITGLEPYVSEQAIQGKRDLLKQISGITDEVAGQSNADTATQAAFNDRASRGRSGVSLTVLDSGFARVAEMFLALCQQYMDMSVPIRLLGEDGAEWRHIAPKDIAGIWDVRPKNSSERAAKDMHRQSLMEGLSVIMPAVDHAMASGKTVDITPWIEELAESYGFPKDRVVVHADKMREQRQADVIADALAQKKAMEITAPPPEPVQQPDLIAEAQSKLFASINYKDLPDAAQADMLTKIGLPPDGVEDDNQNNTRPNAGKDSPVLKAAFDQHAMQLKNEHELALARANAEGKASSGE